MDMFGPIHERLLREAGWVPAAGTIFGQLCFKSPQHGGIMTMDEALRCLDSQEKEAADAQAEQVQERQDGG